MKRSEAKQDIDALTSEVMLQIYSFIDQQDNESKVSDAEEVADSLLAFHADIRSRISNVDGKDNPKLVRSFFKILWSDFLKGMEDHLNKLYAL